jgi:hypothetical protein
MGVIKLIIYPFIFFTSATYYAFTLGSQLPVASRNAGRALGMGFNYFKVALKFFTPQSEEANKIVS